MNEWNKYLETAIAAALVAGGYQRYRFNMPFIVDMKGDKDLVTEVDKESERLIVEHLLSCYPDHCILAEENIYPQTESSFRWVIDPIDGTTNFAHGFPWFCVSIGLEFKGELVAGVIYNPITDELFSASKGGGAYLNNRRLKVSDNAPLKNTLLGTGFPYDSATDPENNFANSFAFQKAAHGIRRAGAAALDLAFVAAGRLDGFWELKLKPWDVAAGVLIIQEAGGMVTGFDGLPYQVFNNRILASNGLIHSEMVEMLARVAEEKNK